MSLMERIKLKHFLQMTLGERLDLVRSVQAIRASNLQEVREKKERKASARSSAPKTKAKRQSHNKQLTILQKALANMTEDQIALLKQQYGLN